jgi:hypothetical protein
MCGSTFHAHRFYFDRKFPQLGYLAGDQKQSINKGGSRPGPGAEDCIGAQGPLGVEIARTASPQESLRSHPLNLTTKRVHG